MSRAVPVGFESTSSLIGPPLSLSLRFQLGPIFLYKTWHTAGSHMVIKVGPLMRARMGQGSLGPLFCSFFATDPGPSRFLSAPFV